MSETLLVLGASARAAAFSARRAGFTPRAADLFADTDLLACCPTTRVDDYPHGLRRLAATLDPLPWIYTGALENYPDLVEHLGQRLSLYGNDASVLRAVRDPWSLADALAGGGLAFPALRSSLCDEDLQRDVWLQKPLRSAGGRRVTLVAAGDSPRPPAQPNAIQLDAHHTAPTGTYFQRFIEGRPLSAVYVAAGGRAMLFGVTRQLIGCPWTGSGGFCYGGSIGPCALSHAVRTQFARIGDCLAGHFELVGLFGVDAVQCGEEVWPVEVNPRYTASVEILERALSLPAIRWHVDACRDGLLPEQVPSPESVEGRDLVHGKAIVFARTDSTVSAGLARLAERQNSTSRWPVVADIPSRGTPLRAGHPVVTVFAAGSTGAEVDAQLQSNVRAVQRGAGL